MVIITSAGTAMAIRAHVVLTSSPTHPSSTPGFAGGHTAKHTALKNDIIEYAVVQRKPQCVRYASQKDGCVELVMDKNSIEAIHARMNSFAPMYSRR